MTEHETLRPVETEGDAMDQALDWLVILQSPTPAECLAFDAWLAEDPAHAAAYARATALWHHASVGEAAQRLDAAAPAKPRQPPRRKRLRLAPVASAAMIVLGAVAMTDLPMRLKADYVTATGERQRLDLQDGSKVLLNTETAFSSQFKDNRELTRLYQGEAFFDVSADSVAPLHLEAGPIQASVRNSAFAVRYLDGEAQVRVQRGNVDLQGVGNEPMQLSAGDSIKVGPAGFGPKERMDPARDLAWVQGRLIFENCPLNQVLAELGRYYPGWILNANTRLGEMTVTGNYRLEHPLAVIRSLAQVTSATIREYPALVILD